MANYDYYVDENGKITRKKKKKEEDNIAYVVSEDGTISPYQDRKTAIRESAEPLMDGLQTVGRVTGAVGESMWKGIIGPSLGKMAIGYVAAKQAEKEREEEYPIAAALSNVTQAMGTVGGAVKDFGVGVAATSGDVAGNVVKGFLGGAEGVSDFLSNGVAGVADLIGFDEYAEDVRDRTAENMYGDFIDGLMDDWGITEHSSLGGIPEQVAQGVGQAGFTVATGAFGKMLGMGAKGVSWLSNGTLFASSAGNGMSQAYRDGASDGEAFAYGVTQGTIEVLTERLFGDLGKWTGNAGLGKSFSALDDKAAKAVGQKVAKALGTGKYANVFKNVVEGTVKAGFGGAEEAIAGAGSSVAKWLIYASEEKSLDELAEIVQDENLLEQFIVGALVSGVMQTPDVVKSSKDGTDLISGRTNDEDAVFNKEYEKRIAEEEQGGKKLTAKEKAKIYEAVERDFAEGGISIDTIEETLGGDTYIEYQNAVNEQKALQDEFDTLNKMKQGEMTGEQSDRRNELKQQLDELKSHSKADEIRQRLSEEVKTLVTTPSKSGRNSPLVESYNERERRKQKFVANLSDYDDDEKETIQRAIDSGILNNTRKTHKFVDLLAKLSADKGVSFDFTNNEKLKESGFAVDGRQVNGYVTVNGVTVNINSNKALNTVVGHEITHVLEGTNLYPELQNILKQYAESKGEYQTRVDAITKMYEGMDADIDAEVTADLVGDYLFTDPDFVRRLSVEHRNVFQKVYDEIKYMAKVATAGSKQARQLEKAMKTFEDAYRAETKNTVTEDGVKYSFGVTQNDINAYVDAAYTKENTEDYKKYAEVSERLVGDVADEIDLNGYAHALRDNDIRHIRNSHGENTAEKYPVTSEDIKSIPWIVENYDKVYVAKRDDGRVGIIYVKTAQDGLVYYLEQVTTKYGNEPLLVNKQMIKTGLNDIPDLPGLKEAITKKQSEIEFLDDLKKAPKVYAQSVYQSHSTDIIAENSEKSSGDSAVKYSLSVDSKGRELSPVVRNRFANTKVVDENGDLKVVYHGTASGEFSIFDKSKGSVEGDFGSGFYFTDDEIDVAEHYEDGGPDFDNKIARRAEQIEQEEDIDYEEAEQRAREELYKGGHLFEVYLNIENPAIVGETMLFESDSYYGEYNEEDYDDYDDYVGDVEQLIADDIENIVWEVEKNVDVYSTDGLANVLFEATYEGGIGIEELKAKINELYLEDSNGNLVGNEVTRQIIESLGYDGIIDHTVSTKWNMDIDENTTHYIVFKPNQIKAVTNENPTDNPDIHRSLSNEGDIAPPIGSYNVYGKDIALEGVPIRDDVTPVQDTVQPAVQESDFAPTTEAEATALADESLPTFTDEDAPPMPETEYDDFTDTTALDPKTLKDISKALKDVLYLNNKEVKAIGEVVQKYSTTEFPDKADLFDELQAKFGQKESVERNEETAAIKKTLREYPINVSQAIKKDIPDYGAFMRRNFGKVRFSKEGVPVDTAYQDLSSMFPGYFPADITNASDQLMRIAEVAGMEINETETFDLSDEDIMEAVDVIEAEVGKYKEAAVQTAAEADRQAAFAHIDDIAPIRDDIAPIRDDIAPIRDDIAPAKESVAHVAKAPTEAKTIKTVQERIAAKLENAQAELEQNITLRAQSNEDFDNDIARMYAEYNSKKNKNTKVANDILRRIKRAERLKADVDAGYEKRISDISEKINKMNSPTYKRAEQRRSKQDEYTAQVEAIVGDTSTWVDKRLGLSYKTNTERRNLRDVVRDANGNRDIEKADRIDDYLLGNYNRNEAKLNRELSDIQKAFNELKLNSKEDVYVQMLGELRHNPDTTLTEDVVKQFYEKNKNKIDTEKVDKGIDMARQLYDNLLERTNAVLREQGMKEIPYRKGYFPHFTAEKQGLLAKIFNWKTRDDEIPTSIAGMTEEFNPNRSWQSFNKERKTDVTDYSFKQGFDHAVPGFLDWIYHMPDIQRRRAVENYIRYTHSEEGIKERIKNIRANEEYDAEEMQAQIDLVYQEAQNPLNNFVTDFRARTNTLAGKKSSLDRSMEEMANRKAYSVMTNISSRVTANMVVGSVSASLTNFIPITQSWGQVSPISSLRAMGDTIRSTFRDDGVINKSDFLTNRLRKAENLHKTGWDKVIEKVAIPMEAIDSFTSQTVWRSKYLENISNGMSENEAIKNADQFAENVIAGRSRGNMPTIFESKNPLTKAFTAFQLEVANQYAYMFKDLPQDVKEHRIGKLTKGYAAMFIGAYAYNALYSSLVGRDVAFDPIGIIEELLRDLFGDDDEEEENKIVGALEGLTDNLLENTPFVGGIFGGGRVPISSALPYEGIPEMIEGLPKDIEEGDVKGILKEILNPAIYLGLPVGGGQIKKTVQGLSMFSEKGKPSYYVVDEDGDISKNVVTGSYTDSGNLRYPVEKTFGNVVQAALFGQYANKNAREYFDDDIAPLKENQIVEYDMLDIPIADYWKYRKGLAKKDTLEEKLDYIDDLDLPIDKKNIMANNVANRESYVDLTDYDDFSGLDEFDFATKNPEKYEFFEKSGITYAAYANGDEDAKRAYNWAYENPEKYIVSQAVASDVVEYRKWASELNDLTGDKDEDGKTINGSRKEKVIDYINHMDADYGAKIILFRTQYKSDDTYNSEIVEYLNSREDITYDEMVTILQELDFKVYPDGTVEW